MEVVVSVLSLWMLHLADVCLPLSGVSLLSDWVPRRLQLETPGVSLVLSLLHRGLTGVETDLVGDWEYQAGSSSRQREVLTLSAVITHFTDRSWLCKVQQ